MTKKTSVILIIIAVLLFLILVGPFLLFFGLSLHESVMGNYRYNQRQKYLTTEEECAAFKTGPACEENKGCNWQNNCNNAEEDCRTPDIYYNSFSCVLNPLYKKRDIK